MQRWEYHEVCQAMSLEEKNALGAEGWELVSVNVQYWRNEWVNERKGYTESESGTDYYYNFKRPLAVGS